MDEGLLIEAIKARPALYDRNDKRYNDREEVESLWEQVASEVNISGGGEAAKRKWGYLRDYYRRQKKMILFPKPNRVTKKKITWPYFDTMAFLDDYMEHITSGGVSPKVEADVESSAGVCNSHNDMRTNSTAELAALNSTPLQSMTSLSSESILRKSKPGLRKRKASETDFDLKVLQLFRAVQESEKNEDFNGNMSFWKGLQPMLNRLDPLESMRFKHEVQGLLIKYMEKRTSQQQSQNTTEYHIEYSQSSDSGE